MNPTMLDKPVKHQLRDMIYRSDASLLERCSTNSRRYSTKERRHDRCRHRPPTLLVQILGREAKGIETERVP